MNQDLDFKCEKYLGTPCYSTADFQTIEKAHSYAGDCKHYRIINRREGKEVFNRDYNAEHVPERFL